MIDYLDRLLGVVITATAERMPETLRVDPAGLFYVLGDHQLPKLAAFPAKRRRRPGKASAV